MNTRLYFLTVCKIRSAFKKTNTFLRNNFESYQRSDVSILIYSILTFVLLKKVYRNENRYSENWNEMFWKEPDRKLFGNDYSFRGLKWITLHRLLKTLSVIFCVAPIFCLVKLTHSFDIEFLFCLSASKFVKVV